MFTIYFVLSSGDWRVLISDIKEMLREEDEAYTREQELDLIEGYLKSLCDIYNVDGFLVWDEKKHKWIEYHYDNLYWMAEDIYEYLTK